MIESVHIRGFRSLADVELLAMPKATVLIGANGSGKSNIIRFLDMLHYMLRHRQLGRYVEREGGADDQLYGGSEITQIIKAEIVLRSGPERIRYQFALAYAHPDRFLFDNEGFDYGHQGLGQENIWPTGGWVSLGNSDREASIVSMAQSAVTSDPNATSLRKSMRSFVDSFRYPALYQFHDTSGRSNFKKRWDMDDSNRLLPHGGNLAAVLHRLEREDYRRYEYICRQIARILPGFDRFTIEESAGKVAMRWQSKWADKTFGAHLTSDGSLRLFALVTLLNLPPEMLPDIILLDEPELGLHPAAISIIGGMISSLSVERQVIVATQSPLLVDAFNLDQIFVLDMVEGQTHCRELDSDSYQVWLDDGYSPGELWQKNLFGGRP